jgi:protein translocase SEC61 complex gamma subunit
VSRNSYPKYEKYSKAQQKKKASLYERFLLFWQNSKRIVKTASKPNRKDYFTVFKICFIGIILLGAVSYVIQLIFSVALPIGR